MMKISCLAFLAICAAIATAQTTKPAPLPPLIPPKIAGRFAWDFAVNKLFVVATYNTFSTSSFVPNPNISLSAVTFGGSYVGATGVGGGEAGEIDLALTGKLFGISLKGTSLSAALGYGAFTGSKPHAIGFFGGSIGTSVISQLFK